jgi:hypothetical protein
MTPDTARFGMPFEDGLEAIERAVPAAFLCGPTMSLGIRHWRGAKPSELRSCHLGPRPRM